MTQSEHSRRPPPLEARLESPSDPFVRLATGVEIGRYRIVERIGTGGMAEVFRATLQGDRGFRKNVVIKLVLPQFAENAEYIELFLDEGRLTAGLSHPNLPQTYELGEHNGRHFIAMEYVNGVSLWRIVQRARERGTPLPLGAVLKLIGQLLECLHYVHGVRGDDGRPLHIVHRDVSPGNLLVTDDGSLKLLDFGIARARLQEHRTAVGQVRGKLGFMSPEQSRGDPLDHRTDLYAVGTLLYLTTVGVGPFEHFAEIYEAAAACAAGDFPRPRALKPDLDEELEQIILTSLALDALDRYATAGSMLEALEALALKLRLMPSALGVAAMVRDLFPERAPQPPPRVTRPARLPRSSPKRDSPDATQLNPTLSPGDASMAATAFEAFTPVANPRVRPPAFVWVAAGLAVALLLLGVVLFALSRPAREEPQTPLREFPQRR